MGTPEISGALPRPDARPQPSPPALEVELVRGLSLVDATMIVVGSMIGSGIFIVSADVARHVNSPGLLLLTWIVTGIMTLIGGLSYGELAAAMPNAGGQYVYLREALGPLWGFLYGWALFWVIQTGLIAAVAVAFAKFFGVFVPWISETNVLFEIGRLPFTTRVVHLTSQNLVALLSILFLTGVNCFGVRIGAVIQDFFTFTKTGAIALLILLGCIFLRNPAAVRANFGEFWAGADFSFHTVALIAVAMVGPLFASDAWNTVTFTAAEVKEPRRNVPLSLALGTGLVTLLYVLCNVAYLSLLPLQGHASGQTVIQRGIQYAVEDRVGAAAGQVLFGEPGLLIMAAAIMISTFGCNNGLILAGARVYYAMARDKLFFGRLGRLSPRYHSPNVALLAQGIWASGLTLLGVYLELLDYLIPAVLVFYILTVFGLFVLRRKRPEMERPYKAFGYPLLPAIYIVLALITCGIIVADKPGHARWGLVIVALGIPAYLYWHRRPRGRGAPSAGA